MTGEGSEFVVQGGAGSIAATVEDIQRCAGALLAAGARAGEVAAAVGATALDPFVAAGAWVDPAGWAVAEASLAAVTVGPEGVLVAAARLHALGGSLAAAAALYDGAEAASRAVVHEVELAFGRAVGAGLAPLVWPLAAGAAAVTIAGGPGSPSGQAAGSGDRPSPAAQGPGGLGAVAVAVAAGSLGERPRLTGHLTAALPGVVGGLLSPAPGIGPARALGAGAAWPLRDARDVAGLVAGVGRAGPWLREDDRVEVSVTGRTPVPPSAGVADLLDRVAGCYPDTGAAPGTVRVDRVEHGGGARAWVVHVPGTQEWAPRPGANPFDLTGNVHSLAGRDTAGRATVLAAMRAAGVRPGEPVLLAGHSQGAMIAAGLAADPRVTSRYGVTHVVAAGAPVAAYRVPARVQVLSVEHSDDLVPSLDGAPNPQRSSWLTLTRRLTAPGARVDPLDAHGMDGYLRSAALVDRSTDPSVVRHRRSLAPFLAGPGVTATTVDVVGRRTVP